MICVVQRVAGARVEVDGACVGSVERGLLVLQGVHRLDTDEDAAWMADRLAGLRVFADEAGKMNLSVAQAGGGVLLVPNFTLCATTGKGHRPGFDQAMNPAEAQRLWLALGESLRARGLPTALGRFGADMKVSLLNDGPITILLNSHDHVRRAAPPDQRVDGPT